MYIFVIFFKRFYLFIHERHRETEAETGRERSRLHAGSLMWDSIPGLQDHTLSRRQMLNHWATRCPPGFGFKSRLSDISMGPPAFFWYPLAWCMIFHPLTFNLLVSIGLRWASCWQRTDGCCFFNNNFIYQRDREREAENYAEREAGSMHREPDVGLDPGSPGSRPGPMAGAKPLRHPGIPPYIFLLEHLVYQHSEWLFKDMNFVHLCYQKCWCFWWRSLSLSCLCCFWSLFFPH